MRIGILETGKAPEALVAEAGSYPDMFQRLLADNGFDFQTFCVVEMDFPADVTDCDAWILTGSRHGAYEDHPFIPPLEDFIRKAYEAAVPMVGICFGHQIIAQALGGRVEKFSGGWAVGPQDYDFGDRIIRLNAWHQDQVVERPAMAQQLATHPFCQNAALIYGDRALTVQAHPEFSKDFITGLMEKRGKGLVPEPLMQAAKDRLHQTIDDQTMAQRIIDFLKTAQPRQQV